MYPETDIPEIVVTEQWKREVKKTLPVPWREKVLGYSKNYGLSEELALQLYDSDNSKLFEELATKLKLEPSVIASILVEIPVRLSREGVDVSKLGPEGLSSVIEAVESGRFAKEAAIDVLRSLGKGEAVDIDDAMTKLGLKGMSDQELAATIREVVRKNEPLVKERGERAFSVLMGEVMRLARGRVDGKKVSKLLKQAIEDVR
jgi:glutamyl-tRNA(Gln) amidotransferase subunit E